MDMESSLEESLYEAVIRQDVDSVNLFMSKGANPNKTTCHGKTCLGVASHGGNIAILKPLIDGCRTDTKADYGPSTRNRHRLHKRRLDRPSRSFDGSSKCKIGEAHNACTASVTFSKFVPRDGQGCRNRGYYIFIHGDGSSSEDRTSPLSTPSTPSPQADLEWDDDVGIVAASTREDETWSSLYKWYAAILESTGAALASAANIPTGLNQQDTFTKTALHYAAEQGQVAALQMLIDAGCKVDLSASDGLTALHVATMRGHAGAVRLLLDAGAHLNYTNNDKMNALHFAADRGYLQLVEMLVKAGASLEARDTSERTALFLAASRGHADVVSYLMQAGANVNGEEIHGYTPLCEAVWQRHVDTVRVLLAAGARVTYSHTLLHNAVLQRQDEIVALLAASGGVNLHDDNGDTPLLLAVRTSQPYIARILLKFGANVNANDSITGATAIHVATARVDCRRQLEQLLIDLLDHGANINATSLYGDTALNRAILLHRDAAATLLVQYGADPDVCYLQACALDNLTLASRRRDSALAALLIKAGHEVPAPHATPRAATAADRYVSEASANPLRLADLCRLALRGFPRLLPLHRFVAALPLPRSLMSFLMLEDEGVL